MMDFYNALAHRHCGKGYYVERCLEPLIKCRAKKASIYSVHKYAADLVLRPMVLPDQPICFSSLCCENSKAVIGGPKGAEILGL